MTIYKEKASLLAGLALVAMSAAPAMAGGIARPNLISARGMGMGSAWSAVVDDPTALHFNPAGLARMTSSQLSLGIELINAPRSYKPEFADDRCDSDPVPDFCVEQEPAFAILPMPSLGFATRLEREGVPSRLTFGVGLWNTFGGSLDYSDDECETCGVGGVDNRISGTINQTMNAVFEIVPGLAYEVNDLVAVGAAIRFGIGIFSTTAVARPNDAEMNAYGLGAGATLGIMITPSDKVNIGAFYRTSLKVTTTGSGTIHLPGGPLAVDVEFVQQWPQEAGIGFAYRAAAKLLLATQFDWHGWSTNNALSPKFAGQEALTRQAVIREDFDDSYTVHLGAEYTVSNTFAARCGFTYDTAAVPIRFQERQFLDSDKMLGSVGASYRINKSWRIDTALDSTIPSSPHVIEDNRAEVTEWTSYANLSPGEHHGGVYTFELAAQYMY
jgi:long-chain fatty acid transport protein